MTPAARAFRGRLLARIRESFIPVLTAIFHVRAPYTTAPRPATKRESDVRRED